MIIVIQCAARKNPHAGFMRTDDGKPVMFVAKPDAAPDAQDCVYARPDEVTDNGESWRQVLLKYNEKPQNNPLGLSPAYHLYENRTYERLVRKFGLNNVFILSAGWGLISASFLTPQYDITFSPNADAYKRRRKRENYADFSMLPQSADNVIFFGGKDYLPLFCTLTKNARGRRTVFYNSQRIPQAPGCMLERFETATRTNWHYECANTFLDGGLDLGRPSGE